MLTTIHITVRDRVPTITAGEDVISHNSDYAAEFAFDEEWQDKVKTVYFVCEDGSYQAVVMDGNSCGVPMLDGEHRRIFVGVQAGSAEKPSVLKTTRPCCLKVKDSIADYLGEQIPDPTPSVYEQIIAMLESITSPTWDSVQNKPFSTLGSGLSVDKNGVLSVAEQVQADWTQNDETAVDFVKNRPCYTEWKAGTYFDVTLGKETATQGGVFIYRIDDNEINWDMLDKTDNQLFVRGRKYNIVFDGVTYTSTAGNDMIGNGHLYYDELEDNGMPFVLSAGNGVTLACKTAGEHSIKVTGEVPTYHKLDKRYYNRPIEYDAGIMDESPSRISLYSYTQAMDIGSVQWDYTVMRPTEEEVKELGDELFNMYPVNLYVTGARNMILGVVPYGDSSLIVDLPVNVGDTKIISITETPTVDVTYRDTNQYLIKIKETGANKPTLYVWFNTYDKKSGARSALVYYNNALYSMELNTNLKIKRIL